MLKFDFVQPGEFDDPFYLVSDNDDDIAELTYDEGFWTLYYLYWDFFLSSNHLDQISAKLKQLNGVK